MTRRRQSDGEMVRDYQLRWQPAVVETRMGCKPYKDNIPGTGGIWKCHADQMVDRLGGAFQGDQMESLHEQEDVQTELEPNPNRDITC